MKRGEIIHITRASTGYRNLQVRLKRRSTEFEAVPFDVGTYALVLDDHDDVLRVFYKGTEVFVHASCILAA